MKKLWYLILTYIWPRAFINVCVSKREYKTEDDINNVTKQESERVNKIRKSHFINFLLVTFLSGSGFFIANTINIHHPLELFTIRVFRLISIIVVAWAVLSKLSWEIQSIGGKSLPEQINGFSFKFFYSLGVFMAVIAIFLEVKSIS